MKTNEKNLSIEFVKDIIRKGGDLQSFRLTDASHYAANATGDLTFATTLFCRKYVNKSQGDEVVTIGNKEFNLTTFGEQLQNLEGKGEVELIIDGEWYCGNVVK